MRPLHGVLRGSAGLGLVALLAGFAGCGSNGGASASSPGGSSSGGAPSAGRAGSNAAGAQAAPGGAGGTAGSHGGGAGRTSGSAGTGGTPGRGGTSSRGGAPADAGAVGAAGDAGGGAATAPDCAQDGDGKTTLVFVNACQRPVTFAGSDITGGSLAPGATRCVDVGTAIESLSAKRYWGYEDTDPGAGHYSLAEFTFNTDFHDFDWYDISYVDAFNLPLAITPLARDDCDALSCPEDFLAACPSVGQLDVDGQLVACVSPERDNGDSPVAQYFEQCDDAYAWSADDQHGDDPSPTHACAGEDFAVTFCPKAAP